MKFLEGVSIASHIHLLSPVLGSNLELVVGFGAPGLKKLCDHLTLPSFTCPQGSLQVPCCVHLLLTWLDCALCSNPSESEGLCVSSSAPSQAGKNQLPAISFQLLPSGDHPRPALPGLQSSLSSCSNHLTHSHLSKRAISLKARPPVLNTQPCVGPVFLFPSDW